MQPHSVQLAVMCDPLMSAQSGFCADRDGGLIRQNGQVIRIFELTGNPNQWIAGLDNKWIFAAGFVATLLSLRGLFR